MLRREFGFPPPVFTLPSRSPLFLYLSKHFIKVIPKRYNNKFYFFCQRAFWNLWLLHSLHSFFHETFDIFIVPYLRQSRQLETKLYIFYSLGRLLDLTAISLFKNVLVIFFEALLFSSIISSFSKGYLYCEKKNVYPSNPDVFFSPVRCRELQTPCLPRRRLLLFNIVNLPSAPSLTLAHHLSLVTCHCICLALYESPLHWPNNELQCLHTTVTFSCVSENAFNTIIIRNNWNH